MNAAHLLVEAGAELNAFNEERKRPLDLCGNNAPMRALLTSHDSVPQTPNDSSLQEGNNELNKEGEEQHGGQVLAAAKDLLSSTIDPVTAYEETIILACDKAEKDSQAVQEPTSRNYQTLKQSLEEHKRIADQFLSALLQVQKYRYQLKENKFNVSQMEKTIDQTESDLTFKLQKKRNSNVEQNQKLQALTEEFQNLLRENADVSAEVDYLEKKLRQLKEY